MECYAWVFCKYGNFKLNFGYRACDGLRLRKFPGMLGRLESRHETLDE